MGTDAGEAAERRAGDSIEDDEYERIWDHAERITERLEALGWVCGHPDRADVTWVLRSAMSARLMAPLTTPQDPTDDRHDEQEG